MAGLWWGLAQEKGYIVPTWRLIKVQMPSEKVLQKNRKVIAIYWSCLGLFIFKIQPITQWKIGQPNRIDRGPFQTQNINRWGSYLWVEKGKGISSSKYLKSTVPAPPFIAEYCTTTLNTKFSTVLDFKVWPYWSHLKGKEASSFITFIVNVTDFQKKTAFCFWWFIPISQSCVRSSLLQPSSSLLSWLKPLTVLLAPGTKPRTSPGDWKLPW